MLVGRSKKVRRWAVSALWSAVGFVDFVSFCLQSVSLRRRGGMADTSDLKASFLVLFSVPLRPTKSLQTLCLCGFAGGCLSAWAFPSGWWK